MLFDFLKKFFWKVDESSRKRKSSDTNSEIGDSTRPKKHCYDFVSSNHVKIISDLSVYPSSQVDKMNSTDNFRSLLNVKNQGNVVKSNNESSNSDIHWTDSSKNNFSKEKLESKKNYVHVHKCESLNQSTLYETHRLAEKKQYNEMLLNFIPPDGKIIKSLSNTVNEECRKKIVNYTKNTVQSSKSHNYKQSSETPKRLYNFSNFLNMSTSTAVQNPKPSIDVQAKKSENKDDNSLKTVNRCIPIEVIKTNTLRDELSTKAVLKHDFISQITKKYNERMEQRHREVDELKKMTYMLSKHNQLTREAALEEHLNRSMRLCEAVLDERDLIEEPKLPELTKEMMERVKYALSESSPDETLVQEFGLKITRRDIQTLSGLNWLNDEVINFYMNLLIKRGNDEKFPNVYAMNTFFYPKLLSGGHTSLKRWTRKIDIFAKDLLVVPIHLGIHWCMSIIDFRNKSISYYDSMGSPNNKCLQALKQYLYDESMDKKKKPFDFNDWNFECLRDIPQQMNGSDCGVFSCMFAEYICANKDLNFSQEDMPYFRNKMIYEILTVQLL